MFRNYVSEFFKGPLEEEEKTNTLKALQFLSVANVATMALEFATRALAAAVSYTAAQFFEHRDNGQYGKCILPGILAIPIITIGLVLSAALMVLHPISHTYNTLMQYALSPMQNNGIFQSTTHPLKRIAAGLSAVVLALAAPVLFATAPFWAPAAAAITAIGIAAHAIAIPAIPFLVAAFSAVLGIGSFIGQRIEAAYTKLKDRVLRALPGGGLNTIEVAGAAAVGTQSNGIFSPQGAPAHEPRPRVDSLVIGESLIEQNQASYRIATVLMDKNLRKARQGMMTPEI